MRIQGVRHLCALAILLWAAGTCLAQPHEIAPDWKFPKAGDLFFPKATDLRFPVPTDLAAGKATSLHVNESASEIRIELSADVLFDFDKATLSGKAQDALQQTASIIREKAKGQVSVDGYTDAKGDQKYNLRLSERRANAVRTWLVQKAGLPNNRFATHGYGKERPVAPTVKPDGSDDPDGRQKNRRVEIVFGK